MNNLAFFLESLATYQYLQNAMAAGVLVGITCSLTGCFIILRRLALMGDAISHAVLPGVVIAYLLGFSYFTGALVTGLLTALGIGYITRHSKVKDDSAIGIMFTAAFALGIVLITLQRGTGVDLWHILFGNVLAVSREELSLVLGVNLLVIISILLFYRPLLLSTFDPTLAQSMGLPTHTIHYLLMVLLTLVTVAALKTTGIILVVAMLVTPGATAYLLTDRLPSMLALSAVIGAISSATGVYLSFICDVATGASIVLVTTLIFFLGFLLSPRARKKRMLEENGF